MFKLTNEEQGQDSKNIQKEIMKIKDYNEKQREQYRPKVTIQTKDNNGDKEQQ